jgi:hypothetical protein
VNKSILALVDREFFPATDGEAYPILKHLEQLSYHFDLTVACFHKNPEKFQIPDFLKKRIILCPAANRHNRLKRIAREAIFREPYFSFFPNRDYLWELSAHRFDLLYVTTARLVSYAKCIGRALNVGKLAVLQNDALTERFRYHRDLSRLPIGRRRFINFIHGIRSIYFAAVERRMLRNMDLIIVQSEADKSALIRDCNVSRQRILVIPNGIKNETCEMPYDPNAKDVLIFGQKNGNSSALIRFFLKKYFPRVRPATGGVIRIVGSGLSGFGEGRPDIYSMDYQPDIKDVFQNIKITIVLGFMRAGILNRVIDSMAAGVPVFGIKAFNGIPSFINKVHGFECDSFEGLVNTIEDRACHADVLCAVSRSGRCLVRSELSWDKTIAPLIAKLKEW